MSPALPFGAPILQRAKDGVCQRASGRVVRLELPSVVFKVCRARRRWREEWCFVMEMCLFIHASHSPATPCTLHTPATTPPQCRQWCRRQYMLNAWPQLPHAGASSSRCHRSRGSGTAGRIPAAATVCAGADASSPTGGTPLMLPVPCSAQAPVPAQGHSVQAPSPKRSGCCRLNLTMWQATLAETVPPPPQL